MLIQQTAFSTTRLNPKIQGQAVRTKGNRNLKAVHLKYG